MSLQVIPRDYGLEVIVNPEGGPGAHYIEATDISINSIQARMVLRGKD